jgi:hypothetical protein
MSQEKYTPQQIVDIEKNRVLNDAELLKGGAEYHIEEQKQPWWKMGNRAEKRLDVTSKQIVSAKQEMYADFESGTVDQQREAFADQLIQDGAKWVVNENGEKHLVLTAYQMQELHDEMMDNFIKNLSPEKQEEIIDFVKTPGELEKIHIHRREGPPSCCERPKDTETIRREAYKAKIPKNETYISVGCLGDYTLIYKGEIPVYVHIRIGDRHSENLIEVLREEILKEYGDRKWRSR